MLCSVCVHLLNGVGHRALYMDTCARVPLLSHKGDPFPAIQISPSISLEGSLERDPNQTLMVGMCYQACATFLYL